MRQGAADQLRDVGQRVQEGVGQVGQQVREGYDTAREGMAYQYRRAEGMIARNPASSVLVGFGVGFGLGVLLTVMMTQREEPSWYERHMDSMRNLPDRLRSLSDAIARRLPDSLHR
jgi:ElaB/YqjD/DUF883 family membrane-anchored ribosome-binding protein